MVDRADAFVYVHEVERRARHLAFDAERMRKALDEQGLADSEVSLQAEHSSLPYLLSNHLGQMGSLLGRIRCTGKHFCFLSLLYGIVS